MYEMLNEGYIDLVGTGNTACTLNTAVFNYDIQVSGVTYSGPFFTATTLNEYPSDNLWETTIDSVLSGLTPTPLQSYTINLVNNTITLVSDCSGDEDPLKNTVFGLGLYIDYDITCTTGATLTPTPTPTITPTNTPVTIYSGIFCTGDTQTDACTCTGSTTLYSSQPFYTSSQQVFTQPIFNSLYWAPFGIWMVSGGTSYEFQYTMFAPGLVDMGVCPSPTPTITPSITPTVTPTDTTNTYGISGCCDGVSYTLINVPPAQGNLVIGNSYYITGTSLSNGCYQVLNTTGGGPTIDGSVGTYVTYTSCTQCNTSYPCPSPTPTPTITVTPTPTCNFKSWNIQECGGICSGGICTCSSIAAVTVYTDCSVTDITDSSTYIYDSSALVSPWTGDFQLSGSIYNSSGSGVTLVCVVGGPC
jgi:hypothetical protein